MNLVHRISALFATALLLAASSVASAETFTARVVDVTSGNIFEVRHAETRELVVLYGVESPSSASLAGKEAKRFASETVLKKDVQVRVVERLDGLTLVEFQLEDGRNLGHVMLRKGLLRWDSFTAPDDKGLQELEQLAKASNRGMWYPELDAPAPPTLTEETPQDALQRNLARARARGEGYRVVEGRVETDETGVKTLILKGNGQKQIGFEANVVQRRMDDHLAYVAEMERLEQERLRREAEAAQKAAEQAERQRQQNIEYENNRLVLQTQTLMSTNGSRLRVWSRDTGWQ